jgi:YhcH/YjgK/YiaL family protein
MEFTVIIPYYKLKYLINGNNKIKKMKKNKIIMFTTACILFSCTGFLQENPENWSEEKLNTWFETGLWHKGWTISPDESINKKQFAIQYYKNKERWDKAFAFPANTDLDTIKSGSYEIEGKDVYAAVSEYQTKNDEDVRFEVHRIYADIQYVIKGEESINIEQLSGDLTAGLYNQEKDIAFLEGKGGIIRMATQEQFFIFFPEDAHRPGIKIDSSAIVKKLVIKVRIN